MLRICLLCICKDVATVGSLTVCGYSCSMMPVSHVEDCRAGDNLRMLLNRGSVSTHSFLVNWVIIQGQ